MIINTTRVYERGWDFESVIQIFLKQGQTSNICDIILQCTEGRQPSVLQLLTLLSMKTRILVSKNATFP